MSGADAFVIIVVKVSNRVEIRRDEAAVERGHIGGRRGLLGFVRGGSEEVSVDNVETVLHRRVERVCEARQRTGTGLEALDRIEYVDAGVEEIGAGNCKESER